MKCKHVVQTIDQLLDEGAVDNESQLKEHLDHCADCSNYYRFWLAQKGMQVEKAPAGTAERIMERIRLDEVRPIRASGMNVVFQYIAPAAIAISILALAAVKYYTLQATVPVTFRISYDNARTIALAGDFNNWESDKTYLVKKGDEWEITVRLKPNRYQYLFVIDGKKYIPDPDARIYADDGFGQKNSIIDITKA